MFRYRAIVSSFFTLSQYLNNNLIVACKMARLSFVLSSIIVFILKFKNWVRNAIHCLERPKFSLYCNIIPNNMVNSKLQKSRRFKMPALLPSEWHWSENQMRVSQTKTVHDLPIAPAWEVRKSRHAMIRAVVRCRARCRSRILPAPECACACTKYHVTTHRHHSAANRATTQIQPKPNTKKPPTYLHYTHHNRVLPLTFT